MTRAARSSAKAVIVEEDRVLLIHLRHDRAGDFYQLPGGGIRLGEALGEAVQRETTEETGYSVAVHELLWVRDYVAANHEYGYIDPPGFHGVELMFRCTLTGPTVAEVHEPDDLQVGIEWVDADRLREIQLFPRALISRLEALLVDGTVQGPMYLGDAS